jgi:stage II sporulation protein D
MKKLMVYAIIMTAVIVVLPIIIVKSCGPAPKKEEGPGKEAPFALNITVFDAKNKKTMEMDIEEYIKSAVAAEMPAEFELEALKAQAVAARTYAYGRINGTYTSKPGVHDGIAVCTDHLHCQAWVSKEEAKKRWGIIYGARNWRKIERAVNETKGIVIEYEGKIINALYHSNSGGKTENCEDVWEGTSVPYLRSVISLGEEGSKNYKNAVDIKTTEFVSKIKENFPEANLKAADLPEAVKITGYTEGGRVKTLKISNIEMKGTQFRTIFGLKSANFKIEKKNKDTLTITTIGYGHGVGMSQYGANYLAKRGGSFDEILKYYYRGVELASIAPLSK